MTPILMNTIAAVTAAAGMAFASVTDLEDRAAYDDNYVSRLSQADATTSAMHVFMRADLDRNNTLNANEYVGLSVITAELAHLNGFITVENGDNLKMVRMPYAARSALTGLEQARIDAVARNTFYAFAGDDGVLNIAEYTAAQSAIFNDADRNSNGILDRKELAGFALRQASVTTGA